MNLLIDHYDSFTMNLFQLLQQLGAETQVVRCDAFDAQTLLARRPERIIFSPGPGRSDDPARVGVSAELLRTATVPMLGVCLGHQLIGTAFGAHLVRVPPRHGKTSWITHDQSALFRGLPERFAAMRYHSLALEALPASLASSAHSDDGVLMALRHVARPIVGVQFHPESIGTPLGPLLLENFLRLASTSVELDA